MYPRIRNLKSYCYPIVVSKTEESGDSRCPCITAAKINIS